MKTIRYMRPIPNSGPFFVISNGCDLICDEIDSERENMEKPGLWIECDSDHIRHFVPDTYKDRNEQRLAAYDVFKKDYLNALQGHGKYFKLFAFELLRAYGQNDYDIVTFYFTQTPGSFDDIQYPLRFTASIDVKRPEDVKLVSETAGEISFMLLVPREDGSDPDVYSATIKFTDQGAFIVLWEYRLGKTRSHLYYETDNPDQIEIVEID